MNIRGMDVERDNTLRNAMKLHVERRKLELYIVVPWQKQESAKCKVHGDSRRRGRKVGGRGRKGRGRERRVPLSLTLCVSSCGLKAFLVLGGYSAFQTRLTLSRSSASFRDEKAAIYLVFVSVVYMSICDFQGL